MLRNIKLTIAYDGTNYGGWQMQDNANTIQAEIDKACKKIFGKKVRVTGSSRTDAGVHADGQVAAIQVDTNIPLEKIPLVFNQKLPLDIVVTHAEYKPMEFHPIFDPECKEYEYLIYNEKIRKPKLVNHAWHCHQELDIDSMKCAAKQFIGKHDFKAFCAAKTVARSTVRTIYDVKVEALTDNIISIRVKGSGFLHNMVRIIVGTLVHVGEKRIDKNKIINIIESKQRNQAGPTAPAEGLTLKYIKFKGDN